MVCLVSMAGCVLERQVCVVKLSLQVLVIPRMLEVFKIIYKLRPLQGQGK